MTDPAELWVGPGSQAAQEKAAYEVRTPGPALPRCSFCSDCACSGVGSRQCVSSSDVYARQHTQRLPVLPTCLLPGCPCAATRLELRAATCRFAPQAAFGPFYRITQLILTTTPAANSSTLTPSGLPAIVTGACLRGGPCHADGRCSGS